MADLNAFELSQIYRLGWTTAKALDGDTIDALDAVKIDSLNPYKAEIERTRWSEGFVAALRVGRGRARPITRRSIPGTA